MIRFYQVDDTFNKVGYDPTANAQATRKVGSAGNQNQDGSDAGGGGLPRIDLSTLLEKVHQFIGWGKICLLFSENFR